LWRTVASPMQRGLARGADSVRRPHRPYETRRRPTRALTRLLCRAGPRPLGVRTLPIDRSGRRRPGLSTEATAARFACTVVQSAPSIWLETQWRPRSVGTSRAVSGPRRQEVNLGKRRDRGVAPPMPAPHARRRGAFVDGVSSVEPYHSAPIAAAQPAPRRSCRDLTRRSPLRPAADVPIFRDGWRAELGFTPASGRALSGEAGIPNWRDGCTANFASQLDRASSAICRHLCRPHQAAK
jgi:hypothetical protein